MRSTLRVSLLGSLLLIAAVSALYFPKEIEQHDDSAPPSTPRSAFIEQFVAPVAPNKAQVYPTDLSLSLNQVSYSTKQLQVLQDTEDGMSFKLPHLKPIDWQSLEVGRPFSWSIGAGYQISGVVDSFQRTDQSTSFGVELEAHRGRMTFQRNNARQVARLFFNGQRTAHRLENDGAGWQLLETTVGELRCASSAASYPIAPEHTFPRKTVNTTPTLQILNSSAIATTAFQSRPGAPTVIYCDFDGESINQPDWHPTTIVAAPSGLSENQITLILQMVAEDFAPFDVNVTNVRSVFDSTPSNKRVMAVSTTTDTASPDAGGVAFLDSFVDDLVCWNFNLLDVISAADTISHEVGHTLNLEHDGDSSNEYYEGHSAGNEFWVPIMGAADSPTISQWSKGEYYQASETEDDITIISNYGISLRNDDYGNSSSTSHNATLGLQSIILEGVIGSENDIDVFTINFTDLGALRIESVIDHSSTNLDVRMRIYDSSNALLIDYNSDDNKDASADFNLQSGTYEVWIEGDSTGSPSSSTPTGWTDYGSLGAYNLTLTPAPPSRPAALDNFGVTLTDSGNAPWFTQSVNTYDGDDALQSGSITDDGTSIFSITKQTTSVSFRYKVSSEQGWDYLEFWIDGVLLGEWSGETGWAHYSQGLSDSTHTFEWRYVKDDLYSSGQDTAWVDALEFSNDNSYTIWASANSASPDGATDDDGNGTVDLLDYGIVGYNLADLTEGQIMVLPSNLELNFYRNPERADIVIRIQVSGTLETWETVAVSQNGANFYTKTGISITHTTIDSLTQKISLDLADGAGVKQFARVLVSRQ